MSNNPNLRKIAEDWDEEYYRSRPELSYSQLSKYAREGFNGYLSLNEHIDTPSLAFGSALDCMLTDGMDSFQKKYFASDSVLQESKSKSVIDFLASMSNATCLDDIPMRTWEQAFEHVDFYSNLKTTSKLDKFKSNGVFDSKFTDYYKVVKSKGEKILISNNTLDKLFDCKKSIKSHKVCRHWFIGDMPFGENEVYYQLKFKATFEGVGYRCMADAILVDHKSKKIYPLDLKTTSKQVYEFYKSFIEWRYDIQARLYWRIINSCVKHSKDFKDYTVMNYTFAVVNSSLCNTMSWVFSETKDRGTLVYGKNKDIILEDPFELGKELKYLIDSNAICPLGTSFTENNNLTSFLKKM